MQRRVDLHRRAEQCEIADSHGADVQDNTSELKNTLSPSSMFVGLPPFRRGSVTVSTCPEKELPRSAVSSSKPSGSGGRLLIEREPTGHPEASGVRQSWGCGRRLGLLPPLLLLQKYHRQ